MDRLGRLVPIIEEICSWWMENKGGGEGLEMLEEGSNRSERRAGVGETGSSRSATGNGLENGRRGDSSARQHQRYDTEIGEIDGNEYNNNQRDLAVRGQGHGDLSELYAKSGEHSLLLVQELSYHEPDEREGEEADAEGEADVGEELGGTWANRLAGRFVKDSMGNSRWAVELLVYDVIPSHAELTCWLALSNQVPRRSIYIRPSRSGGFSSLGRHQSTFLIGNSPGPVQPTPSFIPSNRFFLHSPTRSPINRSPLLQTECGISTVAIVTAGGVRGLPTIGVERCVGAYVLFKDTSYVSG